LAIDKIYKTNSERIVGIRIKCKTYEPLFVFGVYLPANSSIDNFREELNALDDLYAYYSNYGKVVIAGDLNSSCVNTNIDATYRAKSNELQTHEKLCNLTWYVLE
jgi:exonuclease III